jgi:predicted O-methyltransferase YrrM
MGMFAAINELQRHCNYAFSRMANLLIDRTDSRNPLVSKPVATEQTYRELAKTAAARVYPEIDEFEVANAFAISPAWLHDLALHTQVVVKKSPLCYAHGRILYSTLSRYLSENPLFSKINILETGTARGFSSLCMARALFDMGRHGSIMTFDTLPHRVPIYWNCVDDVNGKRSREALLAPWADLVHEYLVFLQGDTRMMLRRVNLGRVHFAFLDGAHTRADVIFEFRQVAGRQRPGDIVVFDDYTPSQYPGLVKAVDEICNSYNYAPKKISAHSGRGYVVAVKQ